MQAAIFIFLNSDFYYIHLCYASRKQRKRILIIMNYSVVISVCSLLLAIYTFLSKNNKDNTSQLTTVIVKLENISEGISDIKNELNSVKEDQRKDHDEIVRITESLKSAWKAINNSDFKFMEEK